MKSLLTTLLFFMTAQAWAFSFSFGSQLGFTQSSYYDSPTFSYPNPYSDSVSVSFKLNATSPTSALYVKSDIFTADEDPDQEVRLYADSALTMPLSSHPIDVSGDGDGAVHSVPIYVKYLSKSGNAVSRAGNFSFHAPIYVTSDSTEYTATLELTPTVQGSCGFLQSSYSVNTSIAANQTAKTSTSVAYNCSPGLTPSLTADSASYQSSEDPNLTMQIFSDSAYSSNLATNPIALVADGTNKTQSLYLQHFENSQQRINKAGTYHFTSTIIINF